MDAVHHVEALGTTLRTTNRWLNALCEQLGWTDSRRAYHALRGVLHALRDRLPLEETAALAAQLPLLVRGIFYEGWHPSGKPLKERMKAEFLGHVATEFRNIPTVDVPPRQRDEMQLVFL